jgi:hypothetical protein
VTSQFKVINPNFQVLEISHLKSHLDTSHLKSHFFL